ncbi:hypothetical protein GCM10010145_69160 [Streptomyces ruber]|uniref:Uncharacterized protein n=2 Tax=Streptomyces TaxID=1883 RepID=A0A918F0J3_9ACTN|nr:hypothetical protein [Streptomyces ruber]GGQ89865.1 hypothetical protein GCM10010145_69160 [Streptomyces ruber]
MNTHSDALGAGSGRPERLVDRVTAGPGGAMTDEVGVITGDLTLATTLHPDGQAAAAVQYTGADEWYTLTGSPTPLPHHSDLQQLHDAVLAAIRAGGGAQAPA